jgi:hypothetical protein
MEATSLFRNFGELSSGYKDEYGKHRKLKTIS